MSAKSDYLEDKIINVLRNTTFTGITTVYLALFTAMPGETGGGTEVSAGGYSRQAVTLGAPSPAGQTSNSGDVTFGPASANWGEIVGFGLFDASTSGNLLYYGPLASGHLPAFGRASDDTLYVPDHVFANDNKVVLIPLGLETLPAGLSAFTEYFVINQATGTVQLAATQGGSAINITDDGFATIALSKRKTVNADDELKVAATNFAIKES